MTRSKLYFAYGSNLNVQAMGHRCPRAKKIGKLILPKARLVFRGVADCIYDPRTRCPGGLWRITRQCEEELDHYEGVAGGLYRKEYIKVQLRGQEPEDALVYVMNRGGVMPPWESYLDTIAQGYLDFGLDTHLWRLDEALVYSYDHKNKTPHLRKRWENKGKPKLARPGDVVCL